MRFKPPAACWSSTAAEARGCGKKQQSSLTLLLLDPSLSEGLLLPPLLEPSMQQPTSSTTFKRACMAAPASICD
uniref:Uncharacterized protein n=1 Tax=Leersia perrieri TaxID=77586 RepID=A0A0D9VQD1_9ORYZ